MKRVLTVILTTIMLFAMGATAFADDYGVAPCYNNIVSTDTRLTIDSNGLAKISLSYVGYDNYTTGATITYKLQKKTWWWWNDVGGASWTEETTEASYTKTRNYQLSAGGTYQLVYEYVIRGTSADNDVVSGTTEASY